MASVFVGPNPSNTQAPPAPSPAPTTLDPGGLAKLQSAKAQAPGAKDMSDAQFAVSMHQHYYSDIPMADYLNKVGLNRGDVLYDLRAPGDPFGDYLRSSLSTPAAGESPEAAAQRQEGSLPVRRAGTAEGMARAFVQGGTMGFGDELVAAGAAALDPLVHGDSGKDFGQLFQAYHDRESQLVDNFRQDNPIAAYGSEIAGAIPSSMAAGGELAGQGANALERLGTRALIGGGQGAVYGAGAADGDLGDRARGAVVGAGLGAGLEAGTGAALDAVQAAVNAGGRSAAIQQAVDAAPKARDLKATSRADYSAADTSGVQIRPAATSLLKQDLTQMLTDEGLMQGRKIVGGYGQVKRAMAHLDAVGSEPMSFPKLQRLNETFQDVASSPKAGEGRIGKMMLDALDQHVDALPQGAFTGSNGPEAAANWAAGKQGWATYKRTKAIEDAVYAARTGTGSDFGTRLRGQIGVLLRANQKRARFSDPEVAAMEHFVEGAPVGDLMKTFAGHGGLPASILGHMTGGIVGMVAAPIAATVARKAVDQGAKRTAARIAAEVATGGLKINPPQDLSLSALGAATPAATNPVLGDPRHQVKVTVFGGR